MKKTNLYLTILISLNLFCTTYANAWFAEKAVCKNKVYYALNDMSIFGNSMKRWLWEDAEDKNQPQSKHVAGVMYGTAVGCGIGMVLMPVSGGVSILACSAGITTGEVTDTVSQVNDTPQKLSPDQIKNYIKYIAFVAANYEPMRLSAQILYPNQAWFDKEDYVKKYIDMLAQQGIKDVTADEVEQAAEDVRDAFGACKKQIPGLLDLNMQIMKNRKAAAGAAVNSQGHQSKHTRFGL